MKSGSRKVSVRFGIDNGLRAVVQSWADKDSCKFEDRVSCLLCGECAVQKLGLTDLELLKEGKIRVLTYLSPEDKKLVLWIASKNNVPQGVVLYALLREAVRTMVWIKNNPSSYNREVLELELHGLR